MTRKHSNHGSSSVASEFMDILSLAFVSVLVLGVIFSIVRPAEKPAQPEVMHYQLFEFEVVLPVGGDAAAERFALRPILSFRDKKGEHVVKVSYDPVKGRFLLDEPLPFEVVLTGFSRDPELGAMAESSAVPGAAPMPGRQTWSVLVTNVPERFECDAQVGYVDRSRAANTRPAITVRRTTLPGSGPAPEVQIRIGDQSHFLATP